MSADNRPEFGPLLAALNAQTITTKRIEEDNRRALVATAFGDDIWASFLARAINGVKEDANFLATITSTCLFGNFDLPAPLKHYLAFRYDSMSQTDEGVKFFKKAKAHTKSVAQELRKLAITRRVEELLKTHKLRGNRGKDGAVDIVANEFGKSSDSIEKTWKRYMNADLDRSRLALSIRASVLYAQMLKSLKQDDPPP